MAYDIFISCRRTDQPVARALVEQLEARGVKVWWDQKIEGGEDWRDAIVAGLEAAEAGEIDQAIDTLRKVQRDAKEPWLKRFLNWKLYDLYNKQGDGLEAVKLYLDLVEAKIVRSIRREKGAFTRLGISGDGQRLADGVEEFFERLDAAGRGADADDHPIRCVLWRVRWPPRHRFLRRLSFGSRGSLCGWVWRCIWRCAWRRIWRCAWRRLGRRIRGWLRPIAGVR